MTGPVSRCVALCAHSVGQVTSHPSRIVKRGVGPMWPVVSRQVAQGVENCDVAGFSGATHGKIYYAVIRKGTPETSAQGSPEARFAGTKEKAG